MLGLVLKKKIGTLRPIYKFEQRENFFFPNNVFIFKDLSYDKSHSKIKKWRCLFWQSKIQYLTKLAEPTMTTFLEILRMLEVVVSRSDSNFILENGGILLLQWTPWKLLNKISHLFRTYGNNVSIKQIKYSFGTKSNPKKWY